MPSEKSLKNLKPKPAKKGEVRNLRGAIGKDPAKAALRRFGQREFTRILDMALTCNVEGLREVIKSPDSSALRAGVAMALLKACRTGDWKTLDGIVSRIIGNVPVRVDHTTKGGALPAAAAPTERVILYLPANGRTKEENDEAQADDGAGF